MNPAIIIGGIALFAFLAGMMGGDGPPPPPPPPPPGPPPGNGQASFSSSALNMTVN